VALDAGAVFAALIAASAGFEISAIAAQPPDVVASDANNNTAMGLYALLNLTDGIENTAMGIAALELNTTGFFNTATGAGALGANETGSYNTADGAQGRAAIWSDRRGSR
jgi:hypothetical protein